MLTDVINISIIRNKKVLKAIKVIVDNSQYANHRDVLLRAQQEAGNFLNQLINEEKAVGDCGTLLHFILYN